MDRAITGENDAYATLLHWYVSRFVERLRRLPADKWDFQFDTAAPSPRTLAIHAWQCLTCDRRHIEQPNGIAAHLDPPPAAQLSQRARQGLRRRPELQGDLPLALAQAHRAHVSSGPGIQRRMLQQPVGAAGGPGGDVKTARR